ncbi:uncharacterized protein LOC120356929 [Solenopsis invicta]|uniref:uncharacterized protein LOC120356929 n=1 Tax=Solenopsis invicta TaxID=13686 RepID=UPI00193DE14F|nr:uncharacterized protein LOC120356929 [Solenopsis invicta]
MRRPTPGGSFWGPWTGIRGGARTVSFGKSFGTRAPPVAETLDLGFLEEVVATLFPTDAEEEARPREDPETIRRRAAWTEKDRVTEGELKRAVDRMLKKNTAPGPNGIPGRVWSIALSVLGDRLRCLFDRCLQTGQFPASWKEAGLVLIPKAGRPEDDPSSKRPICLIPQVAKIFERIVASRLTAHMSSVGPDIERCQFGFRPRKSTVGAIRRLRSLVDKAVSRGGVALAVSLDICNAFNTLPWDKIREGLRQKAIPPCLREVVGALVTAGSSVATRTEDASDGRSAWGSRRVLSSGSSYGMSDTTVSLACTRPPVWRFTSWDLEWPSIKQRYSGFGGPREKGPPWRHISVDGTRVEVKSQMKYLGLILDSRWGFQPHFEWLATKLSSAITGFRRIMPNLGGPCERVRRLYMGVVRSIAMYGASIWCQALVASARNIQLLRREQRRMAIRVVRAYRTVFGGAVFVLAGSVPWVYVACSLEEVHNWKEQLAHGSEPVTLSSLTERRDQARGDEFRHWRERLPHVSVGLRVVEAVGPIQDRWVGRDRGGLSFRMTQVLTGHGCFGEHLHERAGREATAKCHHCPEPRDTAQHTLEICPAWADERRALMAVVGHDLSLPTLVEKILESQEKWDTFASFCETVMLQKEAAERVREDAPDVPPERRRRGGGRRRRVCLQQHQ